MCTEPREYRETTLEDITYSKEDKRRGGGPRVGPFQEVIPGKAWSALPKYDFTTRRRSSCFNERMHVEWENHADHILANGGELPMASVVAKAGFRSCAPCCRDMLALAKPTGKTFIMVDLAEDDSRGTFHFVTGDTYLPVPKEACTASEVASLKKLVLRAQAGEFASSQEVHNNVMALDVPIDKVAQSFYLGDAALLPTNCATKLRGQALLDVLHAEHFARLPAEYGASILRDGVRPQQQKDAILRCRLLAKQALIDAWRPHLSGVKVNLEEYAAAAVSPLLSEDQNKYAQSRRSLHSQRSLATGLTKARLQVIDEGSQGQEGVHSGTKDRRSPGRWVKKAQKDDDGASATTAAPDDTASQWSEFDDFADA